MRSNVRAVLLAFASTGLVGAASPSVPTMETLTVSLSGVDETNLFHPAGGVGDPNGSGSVKLVISPADRRVCYDFSVSKVAEPLMAHILRAPRLKNGPPIVSLFTGPGGAMNGCASANAGQLAEMIAHPRDFYVSFATTEYPDGALRGQL